MTEAATTGSAVGINRRRFLAAGLCWLGAGVLDADAGPIRRLFFPRRTLCIPAVVPAANAPTPILDIHVHLFGVGEGGTGCRIARSITSGLQFQFLVWALGLREAGRTLDASYERVLARELNESGLDGAAILGQDAVYDRRGQPDWERTSFCAERLRLRGAAGTRKNSPVDQSDRADALKNWSRCQASAHCSRFIRQRKVDVGPQAQQARRAPSSTWSSWSTRVMNMPR